MEVAGSFPPWGMWVVMIVATATFWGAVFLAVRALYTGRAADPSDDDPSWGADSPEERFARGEIPVEELERLRAERAARPSRRASPPSHY